MAPREEEETAKNEAFQVGLDHAIFKNIITHNSISNILNLWHRRKRNSWRGNRAIPVKRQKRRRCPSQEMYCAEQEEKLPLGQFV